VTQQKVFFSRGKEKPARLGVLALKWEKKKKFMESNMGKAAWAFFE